MLRWLLVPRLFCLVRIAFVSVSRNSLNDFARFGSFLLLFDSNVGNLLSVFMLFTCAWCYALPCNFYLPHLSTYLTPHLFFFENPTMTCSLAGSLFFTLAHHLTFYAHARARRDAAF